MDEQSVLWGLGRKCNLLCGGWAESGRFIPHPDYRPVTYTHSLVRVLYMHNGEGFHSQLRGCPSKVLVGKCTKCLICILK